MNLILVVLLICLKQTKKLFATFKCFIVLTLLVSYCVKEFFIFITVFVFKW